MTALEMTEDRLRRLLADLRADLEVLDAVAERLGESSGPLADPRADAAARALVAVELHRYYSALEGAFERVARSLDGHVPSGEGWHRDLLRQVSLSIPGVRDGLVAPAVAGELSHLLSFRHFFRHAYAVELDWSRLIEHRDRVHHVHSDVREGFERLLAHVEATLRSLDGDAPD